MEIIALTNQFEPFYIIDTFESLIWVERHQVCGDFELCTTVDHNLLGVLENAVYFSTLGSKSYMLLEKIQLMGSVEEGKKFLISGRSLESILDRRIVWTQTTLEGNLEDELERLFDENIINPVNPNRQIPNFIFQRSNDPYIESLVLNAQYMGENLYTIVCDICKTYDIGFSIELGENKEFIFSLKLGNDHSYDQHMNPYVIFSPDFENIISSDYAEEYTPLKTAVLVAGEGEGIDKIMKDVEIVGGSPVGLDRKEMYSDSSQISSKIEGGYLTEEAYLELLEQKGQEELSKNTATRTYGSQVDTTKTFIYGKDFFIGDVVQISTEYGIKSKARVMEYIRSISPSGVEEYPTFESL